MLLRQTTPLIIVLLGSTLAINASSQSITADLAIDLPLCGGAKQRPLWTTPRDPRGAIVMLPGGAGNVGIEDYRDLKRGHNSTRSPPWLACRRLSSPIETTAAMSHRRQTPLRSLRRSQQVRTFGCCSCRAQSITMATTAARCRPMAIKASSRRSSPTLQTGWMPTWRPVTPRNETDLGRFFR